MINQLGYMAMAGGDLAGAIEIFEANVEEFPESPNVYDSLAQALENDEQYAAAVANYEKAHKRGQEIDDPNTEIYKHNLDRVKTKIQELTESTDTGQ